MCFSYARKPFYSRDLELDPMTLIHELDPNMLKMYLHTEMKFLCQGFPKLEQDQTDRRDRTHYTTAAFVGGN